METGMKNPLSQAILEKMAAEMTAKVVDFYKNISTLAENMSNLADEVKAELLLVDVGVVLCMCSKDEPGLYISLGSKSGIKGCAKHINEMVAKLQEQKNG